MRLLVVSGMLGSGKTSLILRLLDGFFPQGMKVAVIENEFGELGVDTEVLERSGMPVRDLRGGCICCTLAGGLADTLRNLSASYSPDIVVVEPTGIADPSVVLRSVQDVDGVHVDRADVLVLIDCERFLKVRRMFERPLRNQLSVAAAVLLNKTDTIPAEDIDSVEDGVRGMGYAGPVLRIRADTGDGMERLGEVIL